MTTTQKVRRSSPRHLPTPRRQVDKGEADEQAANFDVGRQDGALLAPATHPLRRLAGPADVLRLQQTHGNRHVQRLTPPAPGPGQLQRLIRTPYPWRGVVVSAKGARIRSAPDASDPANILDSVPKGEGIRVTSSSGNWLRVQSRYRGPLCEGFTHHTLVDDAASNAMGGSVGSTMVWRPSGPGSGTNFETWASAATEAPFPPVTSATIMNCWEAVLLSAYRARAIDWTWIHTLYTTVAPANWVASMSRGASNSYAVPGPNLLMPQRGDLVFFDGLAHVALATGKGSEVYTFWPPPNTPFALGGTTDQVKVFTIEALATWWAANMPPAPVIQFASPSW